MTLSNAERQAIDHEVSLVARSRTACIGALAAVQRHRRWISDETLHEVARYLGLPPATLEGVATFYNLIYRRPVGRHVIHLCDSVSCWVMGQAALLDELVRLLGTPPGGTTQDDRFTLLPLVCLGACDRAPALLVDRDLHGPLTPMDLPTLLERYP